MYKRCRVLYDYYYRRELVDMSIIVYGFDDVEMGIFLRKGFVGRKNFGVQVRILEAFEKRQLEKVDISDNIVN